MQREIKFRAWDTDEKYLYEIASLDKLGSYPQSRYILMQFTGLHDKNGKEIYEGDIVSWMTAEHEAVRGKIVWIDGMARFGFLIEGEGDAHGFHWKEALERFEVIGNIYENSDLLS